MSKKPNTRDGDTGGSSGSKPGGALAAEVKVTAKPAKSPSTRDGATEETGDTGGSTGTKTGALAAGVNVSARPAKGGHGPSNREGVSGGSDGTKTGRGIA